jgi:hypothetical protein
VCVRRGAMPLPVAAVSCVSCKGIFVWKEWNSGSSLQYYNVQVNKLTERTKDA